jgi:serine/threonine-protein kinase
MSTCERHWRRASGLAALALVLLRAPAASAQAQDQATARALFDEARQLMASGSYAQACEKLHAASKLYPGPGVLLNLGDCYEHVGRTASAWVTFGEAASTAARAERPDDEDEALRRKAALEPRLARLTIKVVAQAPSGLAVTYDGIPLERGAWGTAIPVDPGTHMVRAEAASFVSWSATVGVEPAGTTVIEVPALRPAPPATPAVEPAPPAPPPSGAARDGTTQRVLGVTAGLAGVAALGVGAAVALAAKSQENAALGESGTQQHDDSLSAVRLGNVATAVVVSGAVLTAGGFVLWLTAPRASARVGFAGTGVALAGSF